MIKLSIECENGDDLAVIAGFIGGRVPARRGWGMPQSMRPSDEDKKHLDGVFRGPIQVMAADLGSAEDEKDSGQNAPAKDATAHHELLPDVIEPSVGDAFNAAFGSMDAAIADAQADSAPVMADPEPTPAITVHDLEDVLRHINSAEGLGISKSREILTTLGVKRVKEIPEDQFPQAMEMALRALQSVGAA